MISDERKFLGVVYKKDGVQLYSLASDFGMDRDLTRPQVDRAMEHVLAPEVGQHKFNRNKLCPVCKRLFSGDV